MSPSENLHYAARFYGMTPVGDAERIPEILERVGFPPDRRSEPMENLSRGMQQKVALARALLPRRCCSCSTSRRRGSTRARSSRCRIHPRDARASTTRRSCSARTTWPRRRRSPSGSGSSTAARLLALEPADELKARYGAETLEEAFFAATGRGFEDEEDEVDAEEREVFA